MAPKTALGAADAAPAQVLVVGEALIDVVHRQDGTVDEHPGGSPANVAITLGRLGRPVELLAWLGEDAYGSMIRRWLGASGVALAPGSTGAAQTSIATAQLDEKGAASYDFEIEWRMPADVDVPQSTVAIHSGSIAATLAPGGDDVVALMRRFHRAEQRPVMAISADDQQ